MQRTAELSQQERVSILSEALPYLQKFRGKTIVIKYGGAAMKDPKLKVGLTQLACPGQYARCSRCWLQEGVIKDLVLLSCVGIHPVFVHGGGPEINSWLDKLGIEHQFKNGLRVTDGALPVLAVCLCSTYADSSAEACHAHLQLPQWTWWRWCWVAV